MTQILAWMLIALGVLCLALLVLLLRQTQLTTRLRRQSRLRDEELAHLVTRRLPALASSRPGLPEQEPGPAHAALVGSDFDAGVTGVLDAFRATSQQARERAEESAENALRGVADRLLTLVYQLQQQIEEMEHEHEDPEVLGSLLPIDHKAQGLARWLFSLRVLTGNAPGRQRPTAPLYDVLRGALSTAPDYHRVRLLDRPRVAVRTQAVEPLIQLFGHLLENAVALSPSSSVVEVSTMRVATGLAVSVEDGGRGISDHELRRIQALAAGETTAGVGDLGDPPRIGYAFTGRIAQRHDLRIVIDRRSRLAGLRVTVTLPTQLLTDLPEDAEPTTGSTAVRAPAVPPPRDGADPIPGPRKAPGLPSTPRAPEPLTSEAPEKAPRRGSTAGEAGRVETPEPAPDREEAPAHPESTEASTTDDASPPARTKPPRSQREPGREPKPSASQHPDAAGESARPPEAADAPKTAPEAAEPDPTEPDATPRRTRHGLPVRRRGAAAGASPAPLPPATAPRVDPSTAGARMGAWQHAHRPKSAPADGDSPAE